MGRVRSGKGGRGAETHAAAAVQATIDEKAAEELKKVAASNPPTHPVQTVQAVQPENKHDEEGDLPYRYWHSQGARRRQKHANRANQLLSLSPHKPRSV